MTSRLPGTYTNCRHLEQHDFVRQVVNVRYIGHTLQRCLGDLSICTRDTIVVLVFKDTNTDRVAKHGPLYIIY